MPAPQQGPTGWIDLTIQGSVMTSNMIPPKVLLNGHQMDSQYGRNVYPVPPGQWAIELYCQWTWKYGRARLDCNVAEGQTVPVFYAAPLSGFSKGAIGHQKQKRPGALGLVLALVVVVAIVVLLSLPALLS